MIIPGLDSNDKETIVRRYVSKHELKSITIFSRV